MIWHKYILKKTFQLVGISNLLDNINIWTWQKKCLWWKGYTFYVFNKVPCCILVHFERDCVVIYLMIVLVPCNKIIHSRYVGTIMLARKASHMTWSLFFDGASLGNIFFCSIKKLFLVFLMNRRKFIMLTINKYFDRVIPLSMIYRSSTFDSYICKKRFTKSCSI